MTEREEALELRFTDVEISTHSDYGWIISFRCPDCGEIVDCAPYAGSPENCKCRENWQVSLVAEGDKRPASL